MRGQPLVSKNAVNPSINGDLLGQARELKINLPKVLMSQLEQVLREERARRSQEENREAIEAHNRFVEKTGCSLTFAEADGAVRRLR